MRLPVLYLLLCIACSGATKPAGHDCVNAQRWQRASIAKHRLHEVGVVVKRIKANRARYEAVAEQTGVPWHVIAALHNMESSGSFKRHLHEGSPLTGRTEDVPKGLPKEGSPPFTWEFSAKDALFYDRMHLKNWKQIGPALSATEGYNGWGYAHYHPTTPSPYNWAATSEERPGKYVADGKWSSTARSAQIGVAAIWKALGF